MQDRGCRVFTSFAMFVFLAAALGGCPGMAIASEFWRPTSVTGEAWVIVGQERSELRPGAELSVGSAIETGPLGHVVLSRGLDSATVAADTQVELVADGQKSNLTRFLQRLGTVIYSVGKRVSGGGFIVDTPNLAAIVKGTEFSVAVLEEASAVHVMKGLVQVTPVDGSGSMMVSPGQSVSSRAKSPEGVPAGKTSGAHLESSESNTAASASVGDVNASAGVSTAGGLGGGASATAGESTAGVDLKATNSGISAGATLGVGKATHVETTVDVGAVAGAGSSGAGSSADSASGGNDAGSGSQSGDSGTGSSGTSGGGLGGALGGVKDAVGGLF